MKIDYTLTPEQLKALSYARADGKPMTEADFKEEILDTISQRLVEYIDVAKRKLARTKTITELEKDNA